MQNSLSDQIEEQKMKQQQQSFNRRNGHLMENENKTDSGFKLDITADTTALSAALPNKEVTPVTATVPSADIEIPQHVNYSALTQPNIQLPESTLFSTQNVQPLPSVQPTKSLLDTTDIPLQIKPEEALKKASDVGKNLELLKKDVQSISDQLGEIQIQGWRQCADNYDEKITIPAQNDIFSNRKSKMSQHPDWK
jgi:hypothetical protein